MERDYVVVETNHESVVGVLKDKLSQVEAQAWVDTVNSIEQAINPGFAAVPMRAAEFARCQHENLPLMPPARSSASEAAA